MSSDSLLPDRQLTFSPELAATIGLEEAILLQGLGNRMPRIDHQWQSIVINNLVRDFPFWDAYKIRELLQRLADLGVIAVMTGADSTSLRVALPQRRTTPSVEPAQRPTQETRPWQPNPSMLDLLAINHGVPRAFASEQLQTFDRGPNDHTRDNRFRQHVLNAWRRQQAQHSAFEVAAPPAFDANWQPSVDALEIMARSGIDAEFIDSVRAEFILYWQERGGPPKEVNSRFIAFVRQRWTKYSSSLTHSTEPTRMQRNWQPHKDVFDILSLSGIDLGFAQSLLPEFILYWMDSNELHSSWNSKFLQHVKHQWQWQQKRGNTDGQQGRGAAGGAGRTKDRSLSDDLTDTSWAE